MKLFQKRRNVNGLTTEDAKALIARRLHQVYYERHVMPPMYHTRDTSFAHAPQIADFERMTDALFSQLPDLGLEIVATLDHGNGTGSLHRLHAGDENEVPV